MNPRDVDRITAAIRDAGSSIAFAVFMGLILGLEFAGCMIATHR